MEFIYTETMGRGRASGNPRNILLGKQKHQIGLRKEPLLGDSFLDENRNLFKSVMPEAFSKTYGYQLPLGSVEAKIVERTCDEYRANYYLPETNKEQQEVFDKFLEAISYRIKHHRAKYGGSRLNIGLSKEEGFILWKTLPYIWGEDVISDIKNIPGLKDKQKNLTNKMSKHFMDDLAKNIENAPMQEREALLKLVTSSDYKNFL